MVRSKKKRKKTFNITVFALAVLILVVILSNSNTQNYDYFNHSTQENDHIRYWIEKEYKPKLVNYWGDRNIEATYKLSLENKMGYTIYFIPFDIKLKDNLDNYYDTYDFYAKTGACRAVELLPYETKRMKLYSASKSSRKINKSILEKIKSFDIVDVPIVNITSFKEVCGGILLLYNGTEIHEQK